MSEPVKLYLDDLRAPPDGWTLAKTVAEAQEILSTVFVSHASLDHDLGDSPEREPGSSRNEGPTGYDLVRWMAETGIWPQHKPMVHSANPPGRARMVALIEEQWPLVLAARDGSKEGA